MQVGRLQRQLSDQPQLRKRLSAVARHLNVQCQEASLIAGIFQAPRNDLPLAARSYHWALPME